MIGWSSSSCALACVKCIDGKSRYWAYKDAWSNDGLPGMQRGIEVGAREQIKPLTKMGMSSSRAMSFNG